MAEFVAGDVLIPWKVVHAVPDHAFFSHRRHVKLAGLECALCHGEVTQMEEPFAQPFLEIEMEWCMGCHEEKVASNDCYACHR